jgi:hypothetical protein
MAYRSSPRPGPGGPDARSHYAYSGREKYLYSWPPAHGPVGQLTAVHSAWHDDIREQEIDIVSAIDNLERGRGIGAARTL